MATAPRIREVANEIADTLNQIPTISVTSVPRTNLVVERPPAQGCLYFMGAGPSEHMGFQTQELRYTLLVILPASVSGDLETAVHMCEALSASTPTEGTPTSLYAVLYEANLRSQARIDDVSVDYFTKIGADRATKVEADILAWA